MVREVKKWHIGLFSSLKPRLLELDFMVENTFYIFPGENFIDLKPYQCGWEKCESGHSYGPTTRNHYLFHYVVRGKGTLMANGPKGTQSTFHINSGQGFLIFPGQITTYFADKDMPWEYTWLEFDGLKVKEALGRTKLTPETPVYTPDNSKVGDLLLDEMRYITHNKDQSNFNLIGHLYLFMDYLTSSFKREEAIRSIKLQDFYMREALNIIEQKYALDISVEDIAERCGVSRSYLSKVFKENVGSSPKDFLTNYRMTKAQNLLRDTELSIADIGRSVGYGNQLHFSRAFKNFCGVSPRQWREGSEATEKHEGNQVQPC